MFQPQPTPFSAFYSDFIPGPIDDLRDLGLSVLDRDGSYAHPQHTGFSSFQQAHFGAGSVGASGGVDPGLSAGPSVGSGGPSGGPGLVSGPGGLGHGGAVATPAGVSSTCRAPVSTAPLSTFPLHGALPHPQQQTLVGAPNLFDHKSTSAHDLHRLRRNNTVAFASPSAASRDMKPDPSLSDDMAAQEAAARTWQPELEVRPVRYDILHLT